MTIAMYLGASKYWWAWLAVRSNPVLAGQLHQGKGAAVLFDDPDRVPTQVVQGNLSATTFFYVLWDGIVDALSLERAAALTQASRGLVLLTVGEMLRIPSGRYEVRDLFARGALHFNQKLKVDARTRTVLAFSAMRNVLMPLKNLRQADLRRGVELLLGKRRLVFCGSYGLAPETWRQLCERHEVAEAVRPFPFPASAPEDPLLYRSYLQRAGSILAGLLATHAIDGNFLFSAMHLLGREFCLRRMQERGMPLFANGYATGANINVYTTPWYRQHVFPDFGSAVGRGNYPRLADLRFYGKSTVQIEMLGEPGALTAAAAEGMLGEYFEERWQGYETALRQALRGRGRIES